MKDALLVVDLLAGIFDLPEKLHDERGFLRKVARMVARARERGVPVVFIQHVGPPGSPFAAGAPGQRIHETVAPRPGEPVVTKSSPDPFGDTELHARLQDLGSEHLFVCGFATEGCIDCAVRAAHGRGYRVTLVRDAHTTTRNEVLTAPQIVAHHNLLLRRFARLLDTDAVDFGEAGSR